MKITVKAEFDVDVPDSHFDSVEELVAYIDDAPEWVVDNCYANGHDRIEITGRA